MKRYLKFLGVLVSLFVLFTISYAEWVCVGKISNSKDYAIFQSGNTFEDANCTYTPGNAYCCANLNLSDNLTVHYVLQDNTTVERTFNLIKGTIHNLHIVKVYTQYEAYMTLSGADGNYLITETIPKENVENAGEIISDAFIVSYDPVIAWVVTLKNNEPATVSYTVKRGTIPDTLPIVRLAECNLKINPLEKKVLKEGDKSYLAYSFEVLYEGNRIIPSPKHTEILIGDQPASFQVEPGSNILDIIAPLGERKGKIPVKITVRLGVCKATYSDLVEVVPGEGSTWFLFALAAIVLIVLLYFVRRK